MDTITHNELQSKKIYQYSLEGDLVRVWESAYRISKELMIDRSNIIACCKGRNKTYKNQYWAYHELTFFIKDGKTCALY